MRLTAAPLPIPAPRRRRWLKPLLALACLLLVTVLVGTGVSSLLALRSSLQQHLSRGAGQLQAASAVLSAPLTLKDPRIRATVRRHLAAGRQEFSAARDELQRWALPLDLLQWLPIAGPKIHLARAATDTAYYATNTALELNDGLAPLWPAALDRTPDAPLFVQVGSILQRSHGLFRRAQQDAGQARQSLGQLSGQSGNEQLDRATRKLRRYLPQLQLASDWLVLAPSLLGYGKPSYYLFAWENPAELRATGGFIGASDFMTVRRGIISHRFAGRVPPGREITTVSVPLPEALYTPETYWIFCDSNWSPDFPVSARLEGWFYGEDTGHWPDGIIDFVDTGIPAILHATGPIYLDAYQRWVTEQNVTALAQHYVNGGHLPANITPAQDIARKRFFNVMMHELLHRLQSLPLARWPRLAQSIQQLIRHRDLLVFDWRPPVEADITASGADGRILRPPGDYLYVVDDNRSYNKLNPYVHESQTLRVSIAPDLTLDETLTLHYSVAPSPASLEGYGPYLGGWGSKHDYQDFLRVYVPPGATLESMSGLDSWAPAPAYGLTQFAGRLLVRARHTATVVIRYHLPANTLQATGFQRYRLTVQRQPGSVRSALRVTVVGQQGVTVTPGAGNPVTALTASLPSSRDATLDLALGGTGSPRLATITPSSPEADPYLPYDSLRDPKHPW